MTHPITSQTLATQIPNYDMVAGIAGERVRAYVENRDPNEALEAQTAGIPLELIGAGANADAMASLDYDRLIALQRGRSIGTLAILEARATTSLAPMSKFELFLRRRITERSAYRDGKESGLLQSLVSQITSPIQP